VKAMSITPRGQIHDEPLSKKSTETLLAVANSGSVEGITRLIQEGANVNAVDRYGKTPLMHASEKSNIGGIRSNPDALLVLIKNGAETFCFASSQLFLCNTEYMWLCILRCVRLWDGFVSMKLSN